MLYPEFLVAAFVVACCFITLTLTVIVMRRESQDHEPEADLALGAPGKLSGYMKVPGKYPAIRTRRSRVLR